MSNNVLFGVDLDTIPYFEDFAASHYAYTENGEVVWAPVEKDAFINFMEEHFGSDSTAQSNFREGVEEWRTF